MEYTKHRFEFFSDGFMAILMTIMVIEIPVLKPFNIENIAILLQAILIFFISFFIVGWFWNKHHHLIDRTKVINNKIIWKNLLFFFFVALIPIFTKMIIENNADNMAIIAYDIVFLLANIFYFILAKECKKQISKEEREIINAIHKKRRKDKFAFALYSMFWIILIGLIILLIIYPILSIITFIVFPIVFALMNLFFDRDRHEHKYSELETKQEK